jgi:hypothetical protein
MANKVDLGNPDNGEVKIEYSGTVESVALYNFLSARGDSHKARVAALEESIKIGGYALGLETTSVFITEIERTLESRVGAIRQIWENRKANLRQPDKITKITEKTWEEALKEFSTELNYNDVVRPTGTNSQDGRVRSTRDRRLGDLEILINGTNAVIAVESKYADQMSMGDTSLPTKTPKLTVEKHARGQVRGAQANRGSHYAIFITKPGSQVAKSQGNISVDYADMAIYVVADIQTGDFQNLKIAYMVARSLTLSLTWPMVQQHHLRSVSALLVRSANKLAGYEKKLLQLEASGKQIASTAQELISDYSADKDAIQLVIDFLDQVARAKHEDPLVEYEEALVLKVKEIELLTNEKLEIKGKKTD